MEEEGETTRSTIARLSAQRSALSAQRSASPREAHSLSFSKFCSVVHEWTLRRGWGELRQTSKR